MAEEREKVDAHPIYDLISYSKTKVMTAEDQLTLLTRALAMVAIGQKVPVDCVVENLRASMEDFQPFFDRGDIFPIPERKN